MKGFIKVTSVLTGLPLRINISCIDTLVLSDNDNRDVIIITLGVTDGHVVKETIAQIEKLIEQAR